MNAQKLKNLIRQLEDAAVSLDCVWKEEHDLCMRSEGKQARDAAQVADRASEAARLTGDAAAWLYEAMEVLA